ncbi:MAG: xanthine dehydrogenase family protein subunit M [Pyrinomonadaceae bacterium]|nr:xanthine dehydrogenase family protein subunit M [Pyrinomonadaceae bacterium]MCX7640569.1 xanthine dehydrogenase family protein subunit M [Pyrinomonadaceae bacterium]MDW8303850.1 xanthine dehydrogenase family protein subunit M [Acidobacteriota bacterium]
MIPAPFEYYKANSTDEALKLIRDFGEEAKFLAGGQSLIPMMKVRFARPTKLIDISKVQELRYISLDGDYIKIGGLTTHRELEKSSIIIEKIPVLAHCAHEIADIQIRNVGTIGGSLAHADPSADYPPVVLALNAVIVAKSIAQEREIPINDFFLEAFTAELRPDELLVEIKIPVMKPNEKAAYIKIGHPATGFSVVNCAVKITLDKEKIEKARVAFGGFVTVPYLDEKVGEFLIGKPANIDTITQASELVAEGREVIGDYYADADYRRHLAKSVFVRVMKKALEI